MGESDSKPYGIVYLVTNMVNAKIYVGQTTSPWAARWKAHRNAKSGWLTAAIAKYGAHNFTMDVLEECQDRSELNASEIHHIARLHANVHGTGYNATRGGAWKQEFPEKDKSWVNPLKGRALSSETRAKISLSKAGVKPTKEHIEKIRATKIAMNFRHTVESRQKMSEASTGRKRKPATEEHRARLSAASKAMWDKRKAMADKVPLFSTEHRAKISASAKARWGKEKIENELMPR